MKIFIYHKNEDFRIAAGIYNLLINNNRVEAYLNVLDVSLEKSREDMNDYIRDRLSTRSHLLVVVSINTISSWWVPWEIGIATALDLPIATYTHQIVSLPGYLQKWPCFDNLKLYFSMC